VKIKFVFDAASFAVGWVPPPPDLLESWDWGRTAVKIFEE